MPKKKEQLSSAVSNRHPNERQYVGWGTNYSSMIRRACTPIRMEFDQTSSTLSPANGTHAPPRVRSIMLNETVGVAGACCRYGLCASRWRKRKLRTNRLKRVCTAHFA